MEKQRKKQIGIGAAALVLLAAIIYGFWPNPVLVETGTASMGAMEVTIEEEGITQARHRYTLSAPATGILQRIELETGAEVKQGEPVARLQPTVPEMLNERQRAVADSRVNAAQSALERAGERLQLAVEEAGYTQRELSRVEQLHENGIGSDGDLERAVLENRRAQTGRTTAEFEVNIAQYELDSARMSARIFVEESDPDDVLAIRSPVDGYLLSIQDRSERTVTTGEPLIEIGDLRTLEIRVDLLSSDAVGIQPGTGVRIKRWGGEDFLEGAVRLVEPAGFTKISALGVEEQRVPVKVDITSDEQQWRRLGDGYRVVVEFILWQGDDVLQVPASALFRGADGWALFVYEEGSARQRTVTIGQQNGFSTQILSGLEQGETILTHPDERIDDGVRVEPRE